MKKTIIAIMCALGLSCVTTSLFAETATVAPATTATTAATETAAQPIQVAWWRHGYYNGYYGYGYRGNWCANHPYRCGRGYYGGGYYYNSADWCYNHPRRCWCVRHPGRC